MCCFTRAGVSDAWGSRHWAAAVCRSMETVNYAVLGANDGETLKGWLACAVQATGVHDRARLSNTSWVKELECTRIEFMSDIERS